MAKPHFTLTAPSSWASAMVNLDYTGLEPEERAALNNFLARQGVSFTDCLFCEEAGCTRDHDAKPEIGDVLAECSTYYFSGV